MDEIKFGSIDEDCTIDAVFVFNEDSEMVYAALDMNVWEVVDDDTDDLYDVERDGEL